jgi:hypothetical protein
MAMVVVVIAVSTFLLPTASAQTSKANSTMTAVSDNSNGSSYLWQNPGNVFVDDLNFSHCNNDNGPANAVSQYLTVNGLGMNIPAGSTINGIKVDVTRRAKSTSVVQDGVAQIIKGGTPGTDKVSTDSWPGSFTAKTYGGSADLWSTSWTASDINASTFGFRITAKYISGELYCDPDIQFIQITVYYTPPVPDAAHSTITPATATITANGTSTQVITVQARDASNNNLTYGGATVVISKSSGTGTVGSTTDNGDGTYTATVTSPTATGSGTFVATLNSVSVGTAVGASSSVVTYAAAAATKLVITSTAVTVTAGVASTSITVQRQDANGNPNTADATRTVTLSSTSGGTVTFNPTSLSIASGSSSATFTYTDTQAGTPTITAASTSPNSITSATQVETVNPAAASKLVFTTSSVTVPVNVASGTITVQRQDQYGNPNTADASRSVTLSSTSGGATFTPASPLTISSGSSSVNFTYKDNTAGTPTITAASTSPSTITSATQTETITSATPPPTNGLVSYWAANNNALDCVGGRNGSFSANTYLDGKTGAGGVLGKAFSLAGTSSSYVNVPWASSLDLGSFTVSTWVYWDGLTHGNNSMGIVGKGRDHSENYQLYVTNTGAVQLKTIVYTGSGTYDPNTDYDTYKKLFTSVAGTMVANTWTHIAGTYNSGTGTLTLYVNGSVPSGSSGGNGTSVGAALQLSDPFTMGQSYLQYSSTGYFGGRIDEVRLYNRALSSTEVGYLMNTAIGPVSTCASTATATTPKTANGTDASTITVTALDANGNQVSGQAVTLSVSGTGNTVSTPTVTDGSGVSTATLKSTKAETKTITVTIGGTQINAQPTVVFVAGAASQTRVETAANGSGSVVGAQNITAGSSIIVYAITRDANGNYVGNPSATWSLINKTGGVADGDLTPSSGTSSTFTGHLVGSANIQAVATFTGISGTQTVIPGTANKLAFTTQPTNTTAGTTMASVVVQIQDAGGNAVSQSGTAITLTLNGSTLYSGTNPRNTAAGGAATFNDLIIRQAGSGLTLTAAGGGLTGATSTSFNITAAGASKLAFTTQPANTTAGTTMANVVVQIQDVYGNAVAQSGTAVTLTLSGSTLYSGTNPQNTAGTGKATFTDLVIRLAGTGLSFSAAGGSLTGATSTSFNITAGTASKLVFTTSPVTTTAGVESSSITIQRQDQYNNPNTTDAARTVTLSSNSTGTVTFNPVSPLSIATGSSSASFKYTDTKAGTPTIMAASTSPNTITSATQQETINPGVADAAHSTISPATASITANGTSTQVITVQARDANNNNLTSGGSTVVISRSSGTGTVGSTTDNSNGTYTATVTSPTATGSGTFAATLGGTAVGTAVGASSSVITYTPGPLHHFAISAISSPQTLGVAFTITTITAQDANNNTVSGFVSTVTFGGTAGVTGTSASFTLGVLNNASVTPTVTGNNLTVTVNDGSGHSGTSNLFNVVNATPSISTISPDTKCAGDATFILSVNGSNFNGSSVVYLGASAKTTTLVSATQLTASIPAADIASPGSPAVTVQNTPGGTSNAVNLTVNAQPTFTTSKTDITCFDAGNGSITITVTGGGTFSYSINNGTSYPYSGASPFTINNLSPGNYKIRVKNSNLCESPSCP